MPIYMDRHDVSEAVTAENVADLHQKDLKIQHKFKCKGLTYWFDDKRKTAFCLIEAPDKVALKEMHDHAHGAVPHKIIEVDSAVVESFLGRIEDPEKSQNTALNIINDPAFRTIMVVETKRLAFTESSYKEINSVINNLTDSIVKTIPIFKGRTVKQNVEYSLISFDSVTNAVLCALEIHAAYKKILSKEYSSFIQLNIGLSAGVPVSEKEGIFEDTIIMAERLCDVKGQIVIASEVKDLYESENVNTSLNKKIVSTLNKKEEDFLNQLMDFIQRKWRDTTLNADDFSKSLGYSKSQLYRNMISLIGKSPNSFIKEYRLNKAIVLLNKKNENISEIAYETGFNSLAYFSKCFQETYGILPSHYIKNCIS